MSRTTLATGRRVVQDLSRPGASAHADPLARVVMETRGPEDPNPAPPPPATQPPPPPPPPPTQNYYYYQTPPADLPLVAGLVTRRPGYNTVQANIDRAAHEYDYRQTSNPEVRRLEEEVRVAASWRPEPPRGAVRGPTETQIRNAEDESVLRMLNLVLQGARFEAEHQMRRKNEHAQVKVNEGLSIASASRKY